MSFCHSATTLVSRWHLKEKRISPSQSKDFMQSVYLDDNGHKCDNESSGVLTAHNAGQELCKTVMGILLHVSQCTRSDMRYSASLLCWHMQEPQDADIKAMKQLLRYIQGTQNHKLTLGADGSTLSANADLSYTDCVNTRRSTSSSSTKMELLAGKAAFKGQLA